MIETLRHKTPKDENFPVASCLFTKHNQKIVMVYYHFARYSDDIADNPLLSSTEKKEKLALIEKSLYGQKIDNPEITALTQPLFKIFQKENLSLSLAGDLLTAFRADAENFHYETWGQLIAYCQNSAAPVGRFLLALHNENPSTYLPASALCAALQILNHVQDVKYDAKILKRVYIPDELLSQFKVKPLALRRNKSSKALKKLVNEMLSRIEALLKDAEVLTQIVVSRRLKIEICIILSLTTLLIKKIRKGDVLAQEIRLSKTDWSKAVLCGLWQSLWIRRKTLTNKGF